MSFVLSDHMKNFPFSCKPFARLLLRLSTVMQGYYGLESAVLVRETFQAFYDNSKRQLSSPDWWIEAFQDALAEEGWEDADIVDDMFPPKSSRETRKEVDAIAALHYDSTHINATKVHPSSLISLSLTQPSPLVQFSSPAIPRSVRGVKRTLNHSQGPQDPEDRSTNRKRSKRIKPKVKNTGLD